MDKRFYLGTTGQHPIIPLEDITLVRLPLGEHVQLPHVKKRLRVAQGTLLAAHPSPNVGDLHAPFDGIIKDVTATFIEIEHEPLPEPVDTADAPADAEEGKPAKAAEKPVEPVAPVSFEGQDEIELGKTLKSLGIGIRPFTRPCDLFVVNCINPEPGMMYTQELLASYLPVVEAGLAMVRRLNKAPRFILALPEGSGVVLPETTAFKVRPVYPISLARPLIRAITGVEDTSRVTLVRLHAVFQLGLVALSGLPLTHTVTTAFGTNFYLPLGTPVSTLLERTGNKPEPGDSVILGGYMRGVAISGLRRGVRKEDDAMALIKMGSTPDLEDNPCINCGACVSVCPMRLRPNMLSRYSEFHEYEACRKENIDVCIECGMCGYVCPCCRPMQQHFRMAKHHLGLSTLQHMLRQTK